MNSSEHRISLSSLKNARIEVDNACRAFDAESYEASIGACRSAMRRLETAIANMDDICGKTTVKTTKPEMEL